MKYLRNTFRGISKPLLIMPLLLAVISITMMVSTAGNNGFRTVVVQSASYVLGMIFVVIIANMDYSVVEGIEKNYISDLSSFSLRFIFRLSELS
jgi:cell division protein FtsW (lipid II flippase)